MKQHRLSSITLVLALSLAGLFCYAECAFAGAQSSPVCHEPAPQNGHGHEAGELCCAPFEALQEFQASALVQPEQIAYLHADFAAGFQAEIRPLPGGLTHYSDLSPPPVHFLTYVSHAPPVFL